MDKGGGGGKELKQLELETQESKRIKIHLCAPKKGDTQPIVVGKMVHILAFPLSAAFMGSIFGCIVFFV
jgi:mannose/fructose/N-acetylgalactosamine-specific phosphotransferase system component IID